MTYNAKELEYSTFVSAKELSASIYRPAVAFECADGEVIAVGDALAEEVGRVLLVRSLDGGVVHQLQGNADGDRYGRSLAFIENAPSGGGALLVGVPGRRGGYVVLLSTRDWGVIYERKGGAEGGGFGEVVHSVGDVDGDGVTDYCVGAPHVGRLSGAIYLLSGADGVTLDSVTASDDQMAFGSSVASIVSDGEIWIYVGAPNDLRAGPHRGSIHAFRVVNGRLERQWELLGSKDYEMFGHELAVIGGFVESPRPCLVVATKPINKQGPRVRIVDHRRGHIVWEYIGESGTSMGFAMVECDDCDGDGLADVCVGSPCLFRSSQDPERLGSVRMLYSSGRMSDPFVFRGKKNCGVAVGALVQSSKKSGGCSRLFTVCAGEVLPGGKKGSVVLFGVP